LSDPEQILPKVKVNKSITSYFININRQFALKNNIQINQSLDFSSLGAVMKDDFFGEKEFKVTGFAESIDYFFPKYDEIKIVPDQSEEAII
jgi:hypothetical protein